MIIFELSTLYIHEKENTSLNLIKNYEILTRTWPLNSNEFKIIEIYIKSNKHIMCYVTQENIVYNAQ